MRSAGCSRAIVALPVVAPAQASRLAVLAGAAFAERAQPGTGADAAHLVGDAGDERARIVDDARMGDRDEAARAVDRQIARLHGRVAAVVDERGVEGELRVL